jgi:hypothetical protein
VQGLPGRVPDDCLAKGAKVDERDVGAERFGPKAGNQIRGEDETRAYQCNQPNQAGPVFELVSPWFLIFLALGANRRTRPNGLAARMAPRLSG